MSIFSNYINTYTYSKYVDARRAGMGQAFLMSYKSFNEIEQSIAELSDIEKNKVIKQGLRNAGNYLMRRGKQRLKSRLIGISRRKTPKWANNGRDYTSIQEKKNDKRKALGESLAASNLYNSFRVRVKRSSLGVLIGFDKFGHHSHLVDRGTTLRHHPITGNSGVMPANNFWTDTANEDWRGAMGVLQSSVDRAVNRIMLRRE